MSIAIVVNSKSGTAMELTADEIATKVGAHFGDSARLHMLEPSDLTASLEKICSDAAIKTIIVAGGDGTVSLTGGIAASCGKRLGVIPLGTMNLFARALRMPLDFETALQALAQGRPGKVDVGEIHGKIFLNHVSIGLHPHMIRMRDRIPRGGRLSKLYNSLKAYLKLMQNHTRHHLKIEGDFAPLTKKAGLAVVTVNPVPVEAAHLPFREGQNYGKLGCYVSTHRNAWQLNVLFARMILGWLPDSDHIEIRESEEIKISSSGPLHLSIDGEVSFLDPPFECRIKKGALNVLLPDAEFEAS